MSRSYFMSTIQPLLSQENPEEVIVFLKNKGLLRRNMACNLCGFFMSWSKYSRKKDGFRWRCLKRACEKYGTSISVRRGSCFNDMSSDLRVIVLAIYLWSTDAPEKQACVITGLIRPTMTIIYAFLRDVCKKYLDNNPVRLGGNGIECQVDESLFCYTPKYHRGRAPDEERWVFGIVDTSYEPALGYMECVDRRNAETLLPIIERVCLPGSRIVADGWAAYPGIQDRGYGFAFVNHSENHVDPDTGVHTQNIESYWNKQKQRIKRMKGMQREYLEDYLYEYMWRERFDNDCFENILGHIRRYYVPPSQ